MIKDLENIIIGMGYKPPSNPDFYRCFEMIMDSEEFRHIYFDDNRTEHFTEDDCLEFILLTTDYSEEIYRLSSAYAIPDSVLERILYFVYGYTKTDFRHQFDIIDHPCANELMTTFPELNIYPDVLSIDGLAGSMYIHLKIDTYFLIEVSELFKIYDKIGKWFRYDGLSERFTVLEMTTKMRTMIEDHPTVRIIAKEGKETMKDKVRYHVVCMTEGCSMYLKSADDHAEALGVVYEYIDSIMDDEDTSFNVDVRYDEENNMFEELFITLPKNKRHLDLHNHFIIFYEM